MSDDSQHHVLACYDCGTEYRQRALQWVPVIEHNDDGIGYDKFEAPLCRSCLLAREPTHKCEYCGREWLSIDRAVECCQHRRVAADGGDAA